MRLLLLVRSFLLTGSGLLYLTALVALPFYGLLGTLILCLAAFLVKAVEAEASRIYKRAAGIR